MKAKFEWNIFTILYDIFTAIIMCVFWCKWVAVPLCRWTALLGVTGICLGRNTQLSHCVSSFCLGKSSCFKQVDVEGQK